MKQALVVIAFALLPVIGIAQDKQPRYAQLTDTQIMFTSGKIEGAKLSECQPLKGEIVEILETIKNAEGMQGFNLVKVRVTEGQCANREGWVGMAKLEAVKR
jgi:hypothetical protein